MREGKNRDIETSAVEKGDCEGKRGVRRSFPEEGRYCLITTSLPIGGISISLEARDNLPLTN